MKEFFPVRLDLYHRRKNALCLKLEKEFKMLENKVNPINSYIFSVEYSFNLTLSFFVSLTLSDEVYQRNYRWKVNH
jgi:hypothetical protein